MAVKDATFDVRSGEIVGIAGVSGNGQTELLEAILGLRPLVYGARSTSRRDDNQRVRPIVALDSGAIDVPEDPVRDAVVPGLSVLEHLVLDGRPLPKRGVGVDWSDRSGSVQRRAGRARACRWRRSIVGSVRCRAATSNG